MKPALGCTVVRRYPVALIVLTGVLRLDTAPVVRAAALKVLADRPTALVLDVGDLEVADAAAVAVLTVVEHHAAAWADAGVLLAAPTASVRAALGRLGSELSLHDTRAGALTAAAGRPVPARVRLPFGAGDDAPAAARDAVRSACRNWGLAGIAERAAQVASELVTNVVEHAGTPGVLIVTHRPLFLHIAVRDGTSDPPLLAHPSEDGGFGLALVAALSSGWGTRIVPDGKVVWATLRIWPGAGRRPVAGRHTT